VVTQTEAASYEYVTWECDCKPTRQDARDHPRYCGKGREVTKVALGWRQQRRAELAAFRQSPPRPEPLPEPEVRAVAVATEDERVPRAARSFAAAAQRAGWETEITYARGPHPSVHGDTFKIVDSILVSCTRGAAGARECVRAHWLNGKADECGYTVNGRGTLMMISQGKRLLTSADHSGVSA